MKIINAKSLQAVDLVKEHLIGGDDYTPGQMEEVLKGMLSQGRETTLFLVAVDGETLAGFTFVIAPQSMKHVFILQAWVDPKFSSSNLPDALFLRVLLWADGMGRTEVRAETLRNPEAFLRRWNFQPYSQVLNFSIPENFEENLLSHRVLTGKEQEHGREQRGLEPRNSDRVDSESESVESREPNNSASDAESGPESPELRGGTDSTAHA